MACFAQHLTTKSSYFRVKSIQTSSTISFDRFYERYLTDLPDTLPLPSSDHDRDLVPYLNNTGIFSHLKPWYQDRQARKSIVEFYSIPRDKNAWEQILYKGVLQYFTTVRDQANAKDVM